MNEEYKVDYTEPEDRDMPKLASLMSPDWRVEYDAEGPYSLDMNNVRYHDSFRYLVKATVIITVIVYLTVLGVRWGI